MALASPLRTPNPDDGKSSAVLYSRSINPLSTGDSGLLGGGMSTQGEPSLTVLQQADLLKKKSLGHEVRVMFRLQKIAAAALVALAGAAGLLVVAASGGALSGNGAAGSEVTVLADSPWDQPKP